ncbi:MAG: hypothetical protein H0U76_14315 [Ktedonobacteraceae bacterium]|nr:hypothetical protein [Ktedonobacteraceae bacterium]
MNRRDNRPKIALATYTPLEYKKLLARAVDASGLDKTWGEWLNNIESVRIDFTAMGYECVRVVIQVDALEQFCREHGLENNGAARAEYASFLLKQQEQRQAAQLTRQAKISRKK